MTSASAVYVGLGKSEPLEPNPSARPDQSAARPFPRLLQSRGRVVLIETRTLLRESLAYLLQNALDGMSIEACASIGGIQPGPAGLILMGPGVAKGASDALRGLLSAVQKICPQAPVGMILRSSDDGRLRDLQPLGLAGVVQDNAGVEIVVAAVRLMLAGTSCFPRELVGPSGVAVPDNPALPAPSTLTVRESQILIRLRAGCRNKVIASALGISENTVKIHVRNVLKKLNASNRTQVASSAEEEEISH